MGLARDAWDTTAFRQQAEAKLGEFAPTSVRASREAVLESLEYRRVDVTDGRQVAEAVAHLTAPLLAYLALPPALFKSAVGMEPLHALNERTLRDRKVDVLRAVRRLTPEAVAEQTIRARYGRGAIGGQEVLPIYIKEAGVAPERRIETFARVFLWIDNWRWAGVTFVLRTGKALRRDRREIAIHFKSVPHLAFGQRSQPESNLLKFELGPDRIVLAINVNAPGELCEFDRVELDSPDASGCFERSPPRFTTSKYPRLSTAPQRAISRTLWRFPALEATQASFVKTPMCQGLPDNGSGSVGVLPLGRSSIQWY